ncbi:protein serine/threonine phosphatase 2C [Byssothecium circinans]|uniref:Protein serine/threonine phosphatase 2C n=1 Tax=Byssothecium circinans TaxID=147558 RepID=A0A6A5TSL9_9PLEO|nr:protein serine/threonine phosphatase 2C [Byssothecium circinans]
MTLVRWRTASRHLQAQNASFFPRIQSSLAARSRTYLRPPTATNARPCIPSERVNQLPSRVIPSCHPVSLRQYFSQLSKLRANPSRSPPHHLTPTLHSAFPTKTVIFLLLIGGLVYYFIDIELADFSDQISETFAGDNAARPLHFFDSKEAVDHYMQFHVLDLGTPLKDAEVLRSFNERFSEMAGGWELSVEEAVEVGMPVTHGCRFKSNEPCEDYFAIGTAPGPGSKPWNFWSIYDGHAGRHTAIHLQWTMHPALSRALSNLSPTASSTQIISTIKSVFTTLDNDLMSRARHAANWYPAANASAIAALTPAFHGSCALVAAFDPSTNKLRVACTGDSRAVLGRWDTLEGKYIAQPLSEDQTGFNPSEVSRIKAAHPDEDDILSPTSGRLLGMAITRAFGDHRWKWDNELVKLCQIKFWGTPPRLGSKTPPYLTAEPEVTETDIVHADAPGEAKGKGKGKDNTSALSKSDFMILASDGLWDHMPSATAVQCVQSWLEARARGNGLVSQDPLLPVPVFNTSMTLDPGVEYDVETGKEITWQADPKFFAIEDDNAAVCLVRNAMGGTRRGLFMGLFSLAGPLCRDAVDDTTVMWLCWLMK